MEFLASWQEAIVQGYSTALFLMLLLLLMTPPAISDRPLRGKIAVFVKTRRLLSGVSIIRQSMRRVCD
jgi:hypothetical protein